MPLDPNDEIEAGALGLRAPQMLGRHLHLAERVLFNPPVFVIRRCARHDVPSPEQSLCEDGFGGNGRGATSSCAKGASTVAVSCSSSGSRIRFSSSGLFASNSTLTCDPGRVPSFDIDHRGMTDRSIWSLPMCRFL